MTQTRLNPSCVGELPVDPSRDEPRCGRPVLLATNTHHWRQRPLDSRSPSNTDTAEALRILRERYKTTIANTVAALRRLSAQLAVIAGAPEVVEALRRELHRIHGAAGSFGFPEASRLAAELEEAAIRWVEDPSLDADRRAAMTAEFANRLEACILGEAGGATTSIVVPLGVTSRDENHDGAECPKASRAEACPSCPDLVIVEDDSTFVEMLRYALESAGFTFLHYANGPDALQGLLALSVGARAPLVLLDVDLPGLDGFSLHERLRIERPGVYSTVFLTARGGEAEQLRAYRAGAIDYVPKPVNLRILMAKLPSWLERSRRSA